MNKVYCSKHGGNGTYDRDARILCYICTQEGINKCQCGGVARYFGEALMSCITCDDCGESIFHVGGKNVIKLWNSGVRGEVI